jgi:hypothetical protein
MMRKYIELHIYPTKPSAALPVLMRIRNYIKQFTVHTVHYTYIQFYISGKGKSPFRLEYIFLWVSLLRSVSAYGVLSALPD